MTLARFEIIHSGGWSETSIGRRTIKAIGAVHVRDKLIFRVSKIFLFGIFSFAILGKCNTWRIRTCKR